MADVILRLKPTLFIMQIPIDKTTFQQVEVRGSGFSYDGEGMLTKGIVGSIHLLTLQGTGKDQIVLSQQAVDRIGIDAGKIADFFGDKFWNHAKNAPSVVSKIGDLSPDVLRSTLTATSGTYAGTDKHDQVFGTLRDDTLDGKGGNDRLKGMAGSDTLNGGAGDDRLIGGEGNDRLVDDQGRNGFSGGTGDDTMIGGKDTDNFSGGAGRDTIIAGGGKDQAAGGADADTFVFMLKQDGSLTIRDFSAKEDHLAFAELGDAKESYNQFMDHAAQVGSRVVYDDGAHRIVLWHTALADLTPEQFTDGGQIF